MFRGERGHAEVEAAGRRGEELAVGHVVGRGRVLGLGLVLVAAGRGRRPVGGRRARVRAVLVVGVEVSAEAAAAAAAAAAAVAPGQLQRLALDALGVGERAVLALVQPVALDLARQVVALHHGEVRGRRVVVVERRREDARPLRRVVVGVGRVPLVAPDLRAAQQLLHRRRRRGDGGGRRAAPGEALVRELVLRGQVVAADAADADAADAADADPAADAADAAGRERAHVRQLPVQSRISGHGFMICVYGSDWQPSFQGLDAAVSALTSGSCGNWVARAKIHDAVSY